MTLGGKDYNPLSRSIRSIHLEAVRVHICEKIELKCKFIWLLKKYLESMHFFSYYTFPVDCVKVYPIDREMSMHIIFPYKDILLHYHSNSLLHDEMDIHHACVELHVKRMLCFFLKDYIIATQQKSSIMFFSYLLYKRVSFFAINKRPLKIAKLQRTFCAFLNSAI